MPHKAIWVNSDTTQEIKTVEGGYKPSAEELVVKTICVGVNPADYKYVLSTLSLSVMFFSRPAANFQAF